MEPDSVLVRFTTFLSEKDFSLLKLFSGYLDLDFYDNGKPAEIVVKDAQKPIKHFNQEDIAKLHSYWDEFKSSSLFL